MPAETYSTAAVEPTAIARHASVIDMSEATGVVVPINIEKLDSLPFYVMLVDSRHHIHFANKAIRDVLGKSLDELVGRYCPKEVHGINGLHPGCPLEDAVNGMGYEREHYDEEHQSWFLLTAYPTGTSTEEGHDIYFHTVQDITERKKAMQAQDEESDPGDLSAAESENIFFEATLSGGLVYINDFGIGLFGIAKRAVQSGANICESVGINTDDWNKLLGDLDENGFVYGFVLRVHGAGGEQALLTTNATLDNSRRKHDTTLIRATGRIQG